MRLVDQEKLEELLGLLQVERICSRLKFEDTRGQLLAVTQVVTLPMALRGHHRLELSLEDYHHARQKSLWGSPEIFRQLTRAVGERAEVTWAPRWDQGATYLVFNAILALSPSRLTKPATEQIHIFAA